MTEFFGTKITEFKDGRDGETGTPAKGSTFNNEFNRLYGNDNHLKEQLDAHKSSAATAVDAVHGIRQGSGNGFDADTVDGKHAGNASGNLPVSNGTRCVNLNADKLDDAEKSTDGTLGGNSNSNIPSERAVKTYVDNFINRVYPVGSFYVQYPDAASNDEAVAFPSSRRPATLFGGTWAEQFNTEYVFFRTGGASDGTTQQARVNGLSNDQMQGHYHNHYRASNASGGLFYDSGAYTGSSPVNDPSGYTVTNPISDNTNGLPRIGASTEPRNRLMKLWKRTA